MQQDRNVNSASITLCSLRQAGHTPQPATNTTNRKTRGQRISFSLGLKLCKQQPGPTPAQAVESGPGLAAANVSAKHTKSCHRSIPDRFLMSAGDSSKNCALCSRWEARLESDNKGIWRKSDGSNGENKNLKIKYLDKKFL